MPMAETSEQYVARLRSYVDGQDPVRTQRDSLSKIVKLVEKADEASAKKRPVPDKWSLLEQVAHLAECEIANSWRYRQILEHSGSDLHGFDQDVWAKLSDYNSWRLRDAVETFRLLRENNLRMLERVSAEDWNKFGNHLERGRLTLRELAVLISGHDVNHVMQMQKLVAG
jgi:hypothetical protein